MKKPIILLIDDDPAVLSALESQLSTRFADIACVEAFQDPGALLQAIPTWESEERLVAIAVVDQKMPGMPGVDLIARLRQSDVCRECRVVLLTGYAGLDSALAAINEAGVRQYLSKPWDSRGLLKSVTELFAEWLNLTSHGRYFVFREVLDEVGLEALLRLRYQVYAVTPDLGSLLFEREDLDLDNYDGFSRHFGLYAEGGAGRGCVIGSLRVITEGRSPAWSALDRIAARSPELHDRLAARRDDSFPIVGYSKFRETIAELCSRLRLAGESTVEASRLTVHPDFRHLGNTVMLGLARHVIESAISYAYFTFPVRNALIACATAHQRLYRPYGFSQIGGTSPVVIEQLGLELVFLHGRSEGVRADRRPRIDAMTSRIVARGVTCHCRTFPACIPGPYEDGDFASSELFCPLRASEVLGGTQDGASIA